MIYGCHNWHFFRSHFFQLPEKISTPQKIWKTWFCQYAWKLKPSSKPNKIEQQSYTAVSDTKDHTAVEVTTFCKKLLEQDHPNLPAIVNKIHYISDSPQKQYRNCTMASFIKNHKEITGVEATHTFLEVIIYDYSHLWGSYRKLFTL